MTHQSSVLLRRYLLPAVASMAIGFWGGQLAYGQDEQATFDRPKYKFLRLQEDWSVLRDVPKDQLTDPWDPLKYIPLNDDGDIWMSLGGRMRLRAEDWQKFAFGASSPPDDTFAIWRLFLHTDVHFGDNVRLFLEGKSALATDRALTGGKRTLDVDSLALQQAFVDVTIPLPDHRALILRPGRQELLFGKQRLVSPLPWGNTLRTWDGVRAILKAGGWNVHGFWTQFAPVRKYDFNEADAQTEFFGVYATGKIPNNHIELDAYFLGLHKEDAVMFNGTAGSEQRYTIGGRTWGKIPDTALDYEFEGAYQFGEVGSGDIRAFMVATEIGYKVADWWGSPRFKLGFDYASGDKSPAGNVETFNQLFPLGHAYLGYMDFVGRQNSIDLSLGVLFSPIDKITVSATGHFFWRADTSDAMYNASGGIVRAGGLGLSRQIGSEFDLVLKYRFNHHTTGLFGYSHFFAGDFIEQSGPPSNDTDFLYVQIQYTF